MVVLGLHKDPWHDTGAAIVKDNGDKTEIVFITEERLNREKDSRKFPENAIAACMNQANIKSIDEIDLVVLDYIESSDWRKDNVPGEIRNCEFLEQFPPEKIKVINHHLSHACVAYYSSPFDSAAVLIIDGRGSDKETQSLFVAENGAIKLLDSTTRMGIGLLYSTVTKNIGFKVLEEGKTMGLAPYGAEYPEKIYNFPQRFEGIVTDFDDVLVWGKYQLTEKYERQINTFEEKAAAAYEIQELCENVFLHLSKYAKKITGKKNLCLSGGSALNSVSNYKILKEGDFEDIYINPAASDTGIPLGCALWGYHIHFGKPKTYKSISPYIGPEYSEDYIKEAIKKFSGFDIIETNTKEKAVNMIIDNQIIAVFFGRSEMGPRALGNRSILVNPLIAENKDILNERVKHREAFRPFAPAIMVEHTEEYFELDRPCPYMLLVPYVRGDKRAVIPAVTHYDGTGRVQTVSKEMNKNFYEIIELFNKATGVPVVLNTSFNVAGEPIVESPEDAIRCFLGTEIDALLIEDYLLVKHH